MAKVAELKPGDAVSIEGLVGATHLNGRSAELKCYITSGDNCGWWAVSMNGKRFAVKPGNHIPEKPVLEFYSRDSLENAVIRRVCFDGMVAVKEYKALFADAKIPPIGNDHVSDFFNELSMTRGMHDARVYDEAKQSFRSLTQEKLEQIACPFPKFIYWTCGVCQSYYSPN